jgi:hypothetical protein
VLDHEDGVARVDQAAEDLQELVDVGNHPRNSGKTGRWFDLIPNICGAQAGTCAEDYL